MMTFRKQNIAPWLAAALMMLGVGCGDGAPTEEPDAPGTPAPESGAAATRAPDTAAREQARSAAADRTDDAAGVSQVVTGPDATGLLRVTIGSTDQMRFTVDDFEIPAGAPVELTLVHEGRMEARVMGHNVVILLPSEDPMAFGQEVMARDGSLDNDYVPEGMRERVVAHTPIIGGGETTTISFTAPEEPDDYPFLCSFPGHFGIMQGTMRVR